MAVTIRANGAENEDQFWLLKSHPGMQRTMIDAHGKEQVLQPVTLSPCELHTYQNSPRMHNRYVEWGVYNEMKEKVHGRRVNDEVELFGMDSDGNETPGLREDMEKLGLTVRSWAPEGTKSKFPSRRLVFGKEKSFLDKCQKTMHDAVVNYEIETDEPIPYALLADPATDGKHEKHLLVVIVDAGYFEAILANAEQVVTTNGCQYKVIGFYHDAKTQFNEDEVAKSFFTKGGEHVEAQFYNHMKHMAEVAAEAARQEKKAAKKHRRQQTAASITTTSSNANSLSNPHEEGDKDAEARAEAKREKERAKKKAYQARRKAKQAESEQALTLSREIDRKAQESEEENGKTNTVGLGFFHLFNCGDGLTLLQRASTRQDSHGEVVSEVSDDTEKEDSLGTESSSNDGADAGSMESEGLAVIKIDDLESGRKAVAEAKGPVMVMSQEDVDLEAGEYNTGFQFYRPGC
ncbi:hypothetical protein LTR85_006501 [Meristemomyces frigidus]|nr:hypothetical protein LTR85_006501 [Meristemomyces frigidus]